jgi:hypothetical protein
MIRRTVGVEMLTPTHRIAGQIQTGAQGLFSFLNLPTESGIDVEEATLCPLYIPWEEAEKVGGLWLVKSEIAVVAAANRGDVGLVGTPRGGYTKPFPYHIRVLVGGFEVRCLVEWPGKLDFSGLVLEGNRPFVAAYDARVRALLFPQVVMDPPAVLFNGKMVMGITLMHRKETQPLGPPPTE